MGTYVFLRTEDFIEYILKYGIYSGTSGYGWFLLFCMWSVVQQSLTYIFKFLCVCPHDCTYRVHIISFFENFVVVVFLHFIVVIYNS